MSKRLNDTAALQAMPGPSAPVGNSSESRSVRKIDNGYIVSESTYSDNGQYHCREYFSEKPPETGPGESTNPMKKAVDYMNDRGTS